MSAQVAKVAAGDPDIVFTGLQDAPFILFMRTLQAQGVDVPVINYEAGSSMNALEGADSANVYVARGFGYPTSSEGPGWSSSSPTRSGRRGRQRALRDQRVPRGDDHRQRVAGMSPEDVRPSPLQQSLDQLEVDTGGLTAGPLVYTADDHAPGDSVNIYRWDPDSGTPELVAESVPGSDS